jgi:hypothetical protein
MAEIKTLKVLAKIERPRGEELRISVDESTRGARYVSLRVWYDDHGEMRPGRQGMAIRAHEIETLIEALPEAKTLMEATE